MDSKLTDEPARLAALARYGLDEEGRNADFDKIVRLVKSVLGVPICAVALVGRERAWLAAADGIAPTGCVREEAFCNQTIQGREPLVVEDVRADARFAGLPSVTGGPRAVGYAGVPLASADGYNFGTLCAITTEPRAFTAAEIAILQGFAALACDEIELRTIARRDFLTGAMTRRAFVEEVKGELKRAQRYLRPASLVAFDLDHFKRINDTLGHGAGDAVLAAVAAECQATLRPSDRLGRLGGEEFAMLLPETGAAEALRCAERLREAIAAIAIPAFPGLGVTASFGIAPRGAAMAGVDDWMAEADAALFRAKAAGRNRCAAAGAPLLRAA